ncbi:MAG: response regulator transcription factor [Sphingobacteriales bacterium]|nr:MAG: response regulator transcription factor [Sphingobacteriales bacterium]
MPVNGNIVLIDDHVLLRSSLANLVKDLGYAVLFEADNGQDFINKLKPRFLPDIVLLDINMPVMDGYETAAWLKKYHPTVKILALTMNDNENAIIQMLKAGAVGYILKDTDPGELKTALNALIKKGFYYNDMVTGKLVHAVNHFNEQGNPIKDVLQLTDREREFLKLVCTELTYKEIAEKMNVSPRTVDGYRDTLFEKLNVKTRVGLAMYAIRNNIVQV